MNLHSHVLNQCPGILKGTQQCFDTGLTPVRGCQWERRMSSCFDKLENKAIEDSDVTSQIKMFGYVQLFPPKRTELPAPEVVTNSTARPSTDL